MDLFKYSKIGQFRNVIKQVKEDCDFIGLDENKEPVYLKHNKYPTLTFHGTVKLHGTNASICYNKKDGLYCQSRNNIITPIKDNAGFAFYVQTNREFLTKLMSDLHDTFKLSGETLVLYGEWCGEGIQKGVAISSLPKMFVVFSLKTKLKEGTSSDKPLEFIGTYPSINLYNIDWFGNYSIDIDFETPEIAQNRLINLVDSVEKECPIGKHFGVSGVGEGIVWNNSSVPKYIFKTKGEKHSVSNVKSLKKIEISPEKQNSIDEFTEYALTENRLNQIYIETTKGNSFDRKYTGLFIKNTMSDVMKEEIDVLVESGLNPKEVGPALVVKIKLWFFDKEKL